MTSPLDHAERIARWLDGTDIAVLELAGPQGTLRIVRSGTGPAEVTAGDGAAGPPVPASGSPLVVVATMPGLFLDRHPLRTERGVAAGDAVRAGTVLAFLRVGPLLVPVLAPRHGRVARVLALPGAVVGYGTPLVELIPAADGAAP